MEDMVVHEVVEWDVPVSYKAIVDGFNEIYHTKELHHVSPEWVKAAKGTSFHIVDDNYMCFARGPRPQLASKQSPAHQPAATKETEPLSPTYRSCTVQHESAQHSDPRRRVPAQPGRYPVDGGVDPL